MFDSCSRYFVSYRLLLTICSVSFFFPCLLDIGYVFIGVSGIILLDFMFVWMARHDVLGCYWCSENVILDFIGVAGKFQMKE